MPELRYNPLLGTYTMVAANRQKRPHMPKNWCPFCPNPNNNKVPKNYTVYLYPNDFPVLSTTPAPINIAAQCDGIYDAQPAYGKCEVILYSPQHTANLYDLSVEHVSELVHLWQQRFIALQQNKAVKYIFPFENRGAEVGVTMPHPHGQLYAYPFVPLKIKTELNNCKAYYEKHGEPLFSVMNKTELAYKKRVVNENEHFVAYLPYFTDYPYGVFIVSKAIRYSFADFSNDEQHSLASILRETVGTFDFLFDRPFPYMMCIHQIPVNSPEYADCTDYYHFHIEFYPPLRTKNKIKWYASSEMGAWAAANVVEVENSAAELRAALQRFKNYDANRQ